MLNKKFRFLIFILLLAIPFVYAYNGYSNWGWGYNSPLYYLENEWVMFGAIFMLFFAIIYYTTNKSFKNPQVSAVVAGSISLLIALTMARRGWLYGFMGDELGAWLMVGASLIGIGFLLKFAYESFGRIGAAITVVFAWILIHNIDPYEVLPVEILSNGFMEIYEFAASFWGLIIVIISAMIILSFRGNETYLDKMLRGLGRRRWD